VIEFFAVASLRSAPSHPSRCHEKLLDSGLRESDAETETYPPREFIAMSDKDKPLTLKQAQAAGEAKLVEMCEDFVMQGDFLARNDVAALEEWFQNHPPSDIPAIVKLGAVLRQVLADGYATEAEQERLASAIDGVVTPEVRAAVKAKMA
jgi:hypothetical protein